MKRLFASLFGFTKKTEGATMVPPNPLITRKELEEQVEAGARRAAKEYQRTFEKLAEYDRT